MTANKRYEFIDVAKGIGIILVVLGHLLTYGSFGSSVIYSFHMPLFFLLSGVFANPDKTKFLPYLGKNLKRLILPYICVFFIGTLVSLIIPAWRDELTVKSLINQFIYVSPGEIHVGQIWFLVCLFNVVIIFYPFYKLILKRNNIVLSILCLACFSIIQEKIVHYSFLVVPFKLKCTLMALVFYSIGFMAKEIILSKNQKGGGKADKCTKIFLLIISSLIVLFFEYILNGYTNLGGYSFGDLYYYFFFALCGITSVIILSKFISRVKILQYIGKNSMFIFTLHSFLIYLYTYILSLLHKTEIINGVNMSVFESIIGCVIITGLMTVFAYLYNKFKICVFQHFLKLKKQK